MKSPDLEESDDYDAARRQESLYLSLISNLLFFSYFLFFVLISFLSITLSLHTIHFHFELTGHQQGLVCYIRSVLNF